MTDREASRKRASAARSWPRLVSRSRDEEDMSRIGKQPIEIPSGVEVDVDEDTVVTVKGPRGDADAASAPRDAHRPRGRRVLRVERPDRRGLPPQPARAHPHAHGQHGGGRDEGLREAAGDRRRRLPRGDEGQGPRDRARVLAPGARCRRPRASSSRCPTPTRIVVRGNDKQQVGEVAANIRKIRKPEPYKGKGIRYEGEYVRKKAGKAAKGATA